MIRAYVTVQPMAYLLAVSIVRHVEDDSSRAHVLHLSGGENGSTRQSWDLIESGDAVAPTFILAMDEAQALLAALHNHFQGLDDQRALRADYDAERRRVDKLTEAVIEIATGRAA